MLSEADKKDLLEMAASASMREESWSLRKPDARPDIDAYIRFLSDFSRMFGERLEVRQPARYERMFL
ncbi:MAG: hypothetical protein HY922_09670 [Elusimicrobia bacterium]|nr:hypothetical protein [Elusimicrobiota bacterium]